MPERSAGSTLADPMKRRRGYAAMIRTASGQGGDLMPVTTTASSTPNKLGA